MSYPPLLVTLFLSLRPFPLLPLLVGGLAFHHPNLQTHQGSWCEPRPRQASTGPFLLKPRAGPWTRRHVSERQVPQYEETLKLYLRGADKPSITPMTFLQDEDFDSYLGDESKLVGKDKQPYKLVHVSKRPLFTREECEAVIEECEEYAAKQSGWTTRRHFAYPTTDLPLAVLPRTKEWFNDQLVRVIYPMLASNFQAALPDTSSLRVVDAFVVKYDAAGGQTQLKPHRDGSVLSFNIALNPASEFEGGGTYFKGLEERFPGGGLRIDQGHVVSHASNVLHGGHPITSGKRFILVAFVICYNYPNFAMRFANLVWDY